ncbi:MAG: carboxypeptidase regulatory-like domain-containing protein [Gemmatimonadaceae bacterium]
MRLPSFSAPFLAALLFAAPLAAQQKTPPKPPVKSPATKDAAAKPPVAAPVPEVPKFAFLQGVAIDSVHEEPLVGALIQVEGTGRIGPTDSLGRFLVDSIPPGTYRLIVDHPLLDTLGIALVTPPITFALNEITRTTIAIPSAQMLTSLFCTAARRALGPGALIGRVREPDTEEPAVGARVSFVWYDPDPPGLPSNLRVKKSPRVREAVVTADGTYRLCGMPTTFEGKLQAQRKDGGATAEVTLSQSEGLLTLRSMSVAALPKIAGTDSVSKLPIQKGSARVFGKVLNANGAPVANARVGLMGISAATLTRANGDFVLDSLPSGTQAIVVRQLGYKPTEVPVELSARSPARVTVKLGIFVPELSPVEVVSARDEGLQKVGFSDRKRSAAGGYFLDPDQLERRKATMFTDLLRTVPGIRVSSSGNGQATIESTRSATGGGCVTVWVDNAQWQSMQAGDLDSFIRPEEVAAVEVYNGISVPPQFVTVGQSCSAVVVWTKLRVQSRKR